MRLLWLQDVDVGLGSGRRASILTGIRPVDVGATTGTMPTEMVSTVVPRLRVGAAVMHGKETEVSTMVSMGHRRITVRSQATASTVLRAVLLRGQLALIIGTEDGTVVVGEEVGDRLPLVCRLS